MIPFDELPRRDQNHKMEDQALADFQKRLSGSSCFILQESDRKDYGTDCQIEVVAEGRATNVRVSVQVKGTARRLNADGLFAVTVERASLNYLLMQPYSFHACYHVPTVKLHICLADAVLQQYEYGGRSWTDQSSELTRVFRTLVKVDNT